MSVKRSCDRAPLDDLQNRLKRVRIDGNFGPLKNIVCDEVVMEPENLRLYALKRAWAKDGRKRHWTIIRKITTTKRRCICSETMIDSISSISLEDT
ncbi:hypothetical protein GWI33_015534 [Rhynchophorus ferrugineus]|uniref:Uncharacterized protein n=1 Tax=Rhynchophorus ferrugineus TaxID=354439 RepID=A0A834I346_RHYFE|nr:hypothetical protein GWI33_015534 [Rhynchophorus ferrugineus]